MSDDIGEVLRGGHVGNGSTPERVAQAVEQAQRQRRDEGRRKAPSTSERERFFGNLAEMRKRVER